MLVTSNRAVGEWGSVFGDAVVATAILDRLLHHMRVPRILVRPKGEPPGLIRRPAGPPPRRIPGAFATPGRCEDGSRCTTSQHKTHSTGAGDDGVVVYGWHPWAGRAVRLHEVIRRAAGTTARCTLVDAPAVRLQEIPVWMLDPVACGAMRATPQPIAALSALMSLRILLAVAGKGHVPRRATLASPESSGDRHATASAPTTPVGPAARLRPDARAVDSDAASLEQPADGDAADPHPPADPAAHRPYRQSRAAGRPSRSRR